jgi:hypothetical protein
MVARDGPCCYCNFAYSALACFRMGMSGWAFPESEEILAICFRAWTLAGEQHQNHYDRAEYPVSLSQMTG